MPKMSPLDLKAMLASERADALAAISAAKLMEERADAMDYYLGDMRKDMPAQEGRSRAVSTDVADTIEGLMPNLMDIFAGSDEVVRFEPVGPEDEAAAQTFFQKKGLRTTLEGCVSAGFAIDPRDFFGARHEFSSVRNAP